MRYVVSSMTNHKPKRADMDVRSSDDRVIVTDPSGSAVRTTAGAWDAAQVAEFDAWLASVPFPVYVSEFTCPAGCVEIASHKRTQTRAATTTTQVTERIFVQERFADSVPPMTLFDMNGGDPQ